MIGSGDKRSIQGLIYPTSCDASLVGLKFVSSDRIGDIVGIGRSPPLDGGSLRLDT